MTYNVFGGTLNPAQSNQDIIAYFHNFKRSCHTDLE